VKINVAKAMRKLLDANKEKCEYEGSMDAIHCGAYRFFLVHPKDLSPKEAFFLGELYQSGSVDAAEYIVKEFEECA